MGPILRIQRVNTSNGVDIFLMVMSKRTNGQESEHEDQRAQREGGTLLNSLRALPTGPSPLVSLRKQQPNIVLRAEARAEATSASNYPFAAMPLR
jgi:hypothetical protein